MTGSIAGHMPGSFQLVYNSTKAFMDQVCIGLASELKETDVTVTRLLPGPTKTEFFGRARLKNTNVRSRIRRMRRRLPPTAMPRCSPATTRSSAVHEQGANAVCGCPAGQRGCRDASPPDGARQP